MIAISSTKRNVIWFSMAVNEKGKFVASAFSDRNRREAERSVAISLSGNIRRPIRRERGSSRNLRTLTRFYDGKGKRSSLNNLDLSSVSEFRRDVYRVLCKIPLGKVATYGAMAKKVRGKRYARAVGTAVATNPLPLIVPCHRVVPASRLIGNYGMCGRNPAHGGYMKRRLLEREGVRFQGERVSKRSVWIPS